MIEPEYEVFLQLRLKLLAALQEVLQVYLVHGGLPRENFRFDVHEADLGLQDISVPWSSHSNRTGDDYGRVAFPVSLLWSTPEVRLAFLRSQQQAEDEARRVKQDAEARAARETAEQRRLQNIKDAWALLRREGEVD